jgi:hypothetical protein
MRPRGPWCVRPLDTAQVRSLHETNGTLLFALTYFCSKDNSAHLYYGNGDSWDQANKLGRLSGVGVEGRVQGFASNRGKIEGPRPGQSLV